MPILLNLDRFLDDGMINNLTNMIQNSLLVYGGLTVEEISSKLVFLVLMVSMCLYVFIIGVANTNLKKNNSFHACFPMCCALDEPSYASTFRAILKPKLIGLLQTTYSYFSSSPKRHHE